MQLDREHTERYGLFALTAALELPVIAARVVAAYLLATLLLKLGGHSTAAAEGWAKLALLPTGWAALALLTPAGSGWWWEQRSGGRVPSEREDEALEDAIERLQADAPFLLPLPRRVFVLANPLPDAAVRGDTLMLSSGLLAGDRLTPVLAHELGHLESMDARLTLAVKRLVFEPIAPPDPDKRKRRGPIRSSWRLALWILRGGIALHVLAPAWGRTWRTAEFQADAFAAHIGQGEALADFLEEHALPTDHPIPLVSLSEHPHPPVEHRIQRLRTAGTTLVRTPVR